MHSDTVWIGLLALVASSSIRSLLASTLAFEPYSERLELSQMADGKVLAQFAFTTLTDLSNSASQDNHYGLLPRSIGEVVQTFDIDELHLTFTQGRWSYDRWGHSDFTAPIGVELWAWFNSTSPDTKWKGLTNALAGLFCSSLNFLDQAVTSQPLLSFLPSGSHSKREGLQIRYGSLPREAVCTENLTPWIKLLPCQAKSGLASLLNAYKIFDGNFQSIGVHIQPKCMTPDCVTMGVEYRQTFAVVLDPIRTNSQKDWSLESLFDRTFPKACPFSLSTTVHLDILNIQPDTVVILPDPHIDQSTSTAVSYTYHLSTDPFQLNVRWNDATVNYRNPKLAPIQTHRYLSGVGQEHGGVVIVFINDLDVPMAATYMDSIPWIIKLFMHTFKVELENPSSNISDIIRQTYYQPAIDRIRPNVLELDLVLGPKSKTTLTFDFDYTFLKYTEHHPDANHGFELGFGVLTLFPDSGLTLDKHHSQSDQRRIYTESLLVRLPTPDFSMPYNVITLTCTLFALFFGSVFNALTREFRPVEVTGGKVSPLQRIKTMLKQSIHAFVGMISKTVANKPE
ncbi:hypothetical protein BDV3_002252 [Batrachochytrium dendrobatidis]